MVVADSAVLSVVCTVLLIYSLLLLVWVVLSWVEFAGWRRPISGPGHAAIELLDDLIRPVVTPLRRIVPPARGLDLSVLVLFVIIFVLRTALCA